MHTRTMFHPHTEQALADLGRRWAKDAYILCEAPFSDAGQIMTAAATWDMESDIDAILGTTSMQRHDREWKDALEIVAEAAFAAWWCDNAEAEARKADEADARDAIPVSGPGGARPHRMVTTGDMVREAEAWSRRRAIRRKLRGR